MGVKIVSKRKVVEEREPVVMPLIKELRKMAKDQQGFVSEETWRHLERPEEYLVVREWDSEDDWDLWVSSEKRVKIQGEIESRLEERTEYNLYEIIGRTER